MQHRTWDSLHERDAYQRARGSTGDLPAPHYAAWEDSFFDVPKLDRSVTRCICGLGKRDDDWRRRRCSALLHRVSVRIEKRLNSKAIEQVLESNPHIALKELAKLAGVSRTTVHRYFHEHLDKTIFVSGWLTWKEGGVPSPLISIKASEHDKSVPKPLPQSDQQRSFRYNAKKRVQTSGMKSVLFKDPILNALLGSKNG